MLHLHDVFQHVALSKGLYSNCLPRYPAPSGFIDRAAIPSDISLKLTAFSVQSKPSASRGKLSVAELGS